MPGEVEQNIDAIFRDLSGEGEIIEIRDVAPDDCRGFIPVAEIIVFAFAIGLVADNLEAQSRQLLKSAQRQKRDGMSMHVGGHETKPRPARRICIVLKRQPVNRRLRLTKRAPPSMLLQQFGFCDARPVLQREQQRARDRGVLRVEFTRPAKAGDGLLDPSLTKRAKTASDVGLSLQGI